MWVEALSIMILLLTAWEVCAHFQRECRDWVFTVKLALAIALAVALWKSSGATLAAAWLLLLAVAFNAYLFFRSPNRSKRWVLLIVSILILAIEVIGHS